MCVIMYTITIYIYIYVTIVMVNGEPPSHPGCYNML